MKKKRIFSIIISITLILLTMSSLLYIKYKTEEFDFYVNKGVMDLENWSMDRGELLNLDGSWEFYPGLLIEPEMGIYNEYKIDDSVFNGSENERLRQYIDVPGTWNSALTTNGSASGSATYRMVINLPVEGIYGIKTSTIRTSAKIFLNGMEVSSIGNPSLDYSTFVPASRLVTGFTGSLNKQIELVIISSSYDYRAGGILKSIKFGEFDAITKQENINKAVDSMAIAACLAAAFYFLFQWLQRKEDIFMVYFSSSSLFMAIYLSTLNEQILYLFINYDFYQRIRVQIVCMVAIAFCFLKFVQHFFRQHKKNKIIKVISIGLLPILLLTFNTPGNPFFIPAGVSQAMIAAGMMVSYSYILWVMMKSLKKEQDSQEYILVISALLFSYWLAIIMKMLFEMEVKQIPLVIIMMISVSTSLLMSNRLQQDQRRAKALAEELVSYDKMKNDFLAKTSHELRTPLHVIMSLSKLMLEGRKGALNAAQQEDLIFVNHESIRLARLVDDLLDASSIEMGSIPLKKERVELKPIVSDLIQEMALLIPAEKQLSIESEILEDTPCLYVDPDRLKQIIYNLVHNSIKYTQRGRIFITTSLDAEKTGFLRIKIADTGTGIAEKDLKKIFDSLYRCSDQIAGDEGMGLGLTIVKHLVEGHGGSIDVASVVGEGTYFSLTLPLCEGENETGFLQKETRKEQADKADKNEKKYKILSESLKDRSPDNTFARRVLIVDDEVSNQKVLAEILAEDNHSILFAKTGGEVMPLLRRYNVDLVILDIMLPDMAGDLVCKKIREEFSMSDLPVLMLTASGRMGDIKKSFEYGANDFIKKPADIDELRSRINSLLLMKGAVEEGLRKEFQYFYTQISPHFLYNTLNTIIGLSFSDMEGARKALYNLGTYLRGKMDFHRQKNLVSLDSELELITAYLEIEELRHKDRLKIKWDIEEGVEAMLPPLTLQPLVENSVRHGLSREKELNIQITIRKSKDDLISIMIKDDGPGIPKDVREELLSGEGKGIGFASVIKRINLIRGASIDINSQVGLGTLVRIEIAEVARNEGYNS